MAKLNDVNWHEGRPPIDGLFLVSDLKDKIILATYKNGEPIHNQVDIGQMYPIHHSLVLKDVAKNKI